MHPRRLGPAYQLLAALLLVASAAVVAPRIAGGSPPVDNLASSGGTVMPSTTTYAIYWLPSGDSFEPGGSDSRYESLTQQFLGDVGGTNLYNIVVQYPDGSGNPPDNSSVLGGSSVDTSAYPKAGTQAAPLLDADIRAEVSRVMTTKGWSASPSNLYLVYTADDIQTCLNGPSGNCSWDAFCGYHSWFVPSGSTQPVFYAVLPDAGQNNGQCLTNGSSDSAYPNGDAFADSEISLTSKELFAAVTDPQGDGWTDSSGAEIGDKCDWTFGTIGSDGSNVTLNNGHKYLVQQERSNAASGCTLSYTGTGTHPRWSRLTPTADPGPPTSTPTPVPNQRNRLTPTPTPGPGGPTATPTPVTGRGRRPTSFPPGAIMRARALHRQAGEPSGKRTEERMTAHDDAMTRHQSENGSVGQTHRRTRRDHAPNDPQRTHVQAQIQSARTRRSAQEPPHTHIERGHVKVEERRRTRHGADAT